jgi:hypothetical protein
MHLALALALWVELAHHRIAFQSLVVKHSLGEQWIGWLYALSGISPAVLAYGYARVGQQKVKPPHCCRVRLPGTMGLSR